MPDFHVDTSQLTGLARDIASARLKVVPALLPVAKRAGVGMKRTLVSDSSGHGHLPGLPRTVEFDVEITPSGVSVEAGFRKSGQGNLANIAAFGSVNNAPVMDVTRALTAEVPGFMRWVGQVAAKALW